MQVIEEISSMSDCHRPEKVPKALSSKRHGTEAREKYWRWTELYVCNIIIMMCRISEVSKSLRVSSFDKCRGIEGVPVSHLGVNYDAVGQGKLLNGSFGKYSLNGRESNLIFNVDKTTTVIHKDASTFECGRGCFSKGIK